MIDRLSGATKYSRELVFSGKKKFLKYDLIMCFFGSVELISFN